MEKVINFIGNRLPKLSEDDSKNFADRIAESFIVGSGSPEAQALYIRAWALWIKHEPSTASAHFSALAKRVRDSDIRTIAEHMGNSHRKNETAISAFHTSMKRNRERTLGQALFEQMPDQTYATGYIKRALDKKKISAQALDQALQEAWTENTTERRENLKAIAAFLGSYEVVEWWKNLDSKMQETYIHKGSRFFSK